MTLTPEESAAVERLSDPMERRIAEALTAADVLFRIDGQADTKGLDFHIPDAARSGPGVYIEVKRFHSDRIAGQMGRANDVIAIQGEGAVNWFCALLAALQRPMPGRADVEAVILKYVRKSPARFGNIIGVRPAADALLTLFRRPS